MALTVYGIPSCGTVKKVRADLEHRGIAHTFVDFRANPPPRAQVARWVAAFGKQALRNTSGASFRALGPERDAWTDDQWITAFAADPMLIKRPVVERDGAPVAVGKSEPERV